MIATIVTINAKPDCTGPLIRALEENAKHSRKEPGCRKWEYSRNLENPNQFAIYELYDDMAAVQAHAGSAHLIAFKVIAEPLWESKDSGRFEVL